MDKLAHLSTVIKNVFVDISNDPSRNGFLPLFQGMLTRPLIMFNAAYQVFSGHLTGDSSQMDRWLTNQLQVVTLLGEHQAGFTQLGELFQELLRATPGCDGADIVDATLYKNRSFIIALAFRIYLNDFPVSEDMARDLKTAEGNKK